MGGEVAVTAAASEAGLAAVVAEGISARVPADLAYLPDDVSGVIQRLDGEIDVGRGGSHDGRGHADAPA